MAQKLTLRRLLSRLLTADEVDDNFAAVAADFSGTTDPAAIAGASVLPYMSWADTGTGWLKRRNAANTGWAEERRLLRRAIHPFNTNETPTSDIGPVWLNGKGMAEWATSKGAYQLHGTPIRLAASGSNLDLLTEDGAWWQDTNAGAGAGAGYPVPKAGTLFVKKGGEVGVTAFQTYVTLDSEVYWRSTVNGSFGAWIKTANEAQIVNLLTIINAAFGVNQSLVDVTASRNANGTLYVNSTGRPIQVSVAGVTTGDIANFQILSQGRILTRPAWAAAMTGAGVGASAIVPAGQNYAVVAYNIDTVTWMEYR